MSEENDALEPPFDDAERREAEALALALERGTASEGLPEDALQVAAMIRYGEGGGALSEAREDALLADVLAAADRVAAKRPAPRVAWWRWALGMGVAVAVIALFVVARPAPDATALPVPSRALLEAQLARADGRDEGFDEAMGDYRGAVYAALEARYGGR